MGNAPKRKKGVSLHKIKQSGERLQVEKAKAVAVLESSNRFMAWIMGLLLALAPLLICGSFQWLAKGDDARIGVYRTFFQNYLSEGSFLWLGITLLATSLIDLLLYGFRNATKTGWRVVLIFVSAILCVVGFLLYFANIEKPLNDARMEIVSVILFILFAVTSFILSFHVSKGD